MITIKKLKNYQIQKAIRAEKKPAPNIVNLKINSTQ